MQKGQVKAFMFITPISSRIVPLEAMESKLISSQKVNESEQSEEIGSPSFLDVFTGIVNSAVETDAQKNQDMLDLMLGDVDNLEQIEINKTKALVATELLVNVKNSVVDAYNEIIKMSI